jgi:hypothetical protein
MEHDIRFIWSDIEDLAFTTRSSRESDGFGRRCCIEHDFARESQSRTNTGTEAMIVESRSWGAQFGAAEKDEEGMALKILTRAEDKPDVRKINGKFCI